MTERVVDVLEPVEVHHQHAESAALAAGGGQHLLLRGAVEHVVARLMDGDRGPVLLPGDRQGLGERRVRITGNPGIQDLPLANQGFQGPERLLHWCLRITPMAVKNIDVVDAHPLQRLFATRDEMLPAAPIAIGAGPHRIAGLGGDHQFVAGHLLENPPEEFFAGSRGGAVVVGQVEVRDAMVERGEKDLLRLFILDITPRALPQTKADGGKFEPTAATTAVGHGGVALRGEFHGDSLGWSSRPIGRAMTASGPRLGPHRQPQIYGGKPEVLILFQMGYLRAQGGHGAMG